MTKLNNYSVFISDKKANVLQNTYVCSLYKYNVEHVKFYYQIMRDTEWMML